MPSTAKRLSAACPAFGEPRAVGSEGRQRPRPRCDVVGREALSLWTDAQDLSRATAIGDEHGQPEPERLDGGERIRFSVRGQREDVRARVERPERLTAYEAVQAHARLDAEAPDKRAHAAHLGSIRVEGARDVELERAAWARDRVDEAVQALGLDDRCRGQHAQGPRHAGARGDRRSVGATNGHVVAPAGATTVGMSRTSGARASRSVLSQTATMPSTVRR